MVFGVVCGVLAVGLAGQAVQERFFSTAEYSQDSSATTRFESWHAAYKMACKEPIFGYGTRISPYFIRDFRSDLQEQIVEDMRNKDGVTAVHNQYLQIAADNGFVGMGLYIGAILASIFGYQRVIRATRHDPHPDAKTLLVTAYAMQTSLVTFCFGAMFLSLESFEPQYYMIFLGCHLPLLLNAKTAWTGMAYPRQMPALPVAGRGYLPPPRPMTAPPTQPS